MRKDAILGTLKRMKYAESLQLEKVKKLFPDTASGKTMVFFLLL